MTRFVMTLFVVIVVIGVVLAALGTLRFQNTTDESRIILDKKELKVQAQNAEAAGGKVLDKTSEDLHKAAERLQDTPNKQQPPAATPATKENNKPAGTRPPDASKHLPENNRGN
jgi:hypothetical protein